MQIIGITGGSGAGKGYIGNILSEYGIKTVDADEVYRAVSQPGTPCLRELAQTFGDGVIAADGQLDRKALAEIVFAPGAEALLSKLNTVTHKYVLERCRAWLRERERAGDRAAAVDAPLLFESGFARECDVTVAVVADRAQRLRRIMRRDGLSEADALRRVDAQPEDGFYTSRADHTVINNDGCDVRGQVTRILAALGLSGAAEERA